MSSPDPLNLFEQSDFTDKDSDSIDEESDSVDEDSHSAVESRPVTPPRSVRQPDGKYVEDSPGKGNSTQSRSYRKGKLNDMREAVLEGLGGCIPEISFSEFVKNILPPLREDFDVSEIVEFLRQSEVFNSSQQALAAFTIEPKNQQAHEDVVFAPLPKICDEICRLALQNAESVAVEEEYFLGMCPNHAPFADVLMKHRPDGCFLHKSMREFVDLLRGEDGETKRTKKRRRKKINTLKNQGKYFTLYELGAPMEAKKHSSGRNDNVKKIVFHAQQTIAHDPCRRFVIGITIENTDMRLWFFSRGTPVVSEAFDFTRNIEKLAQVVLSLSFASQEELGWDTTVEPSSAASGNREYIIEVNGNKYRTERVIQSVKAHALISSGTRVWEVTDVATGESRVLKDTWMDVDRRTEREIYDLILHDVQEKYGLSIRHFVESHLLTPIEDCFAPVEGGIDYTTDIMTQDDPRTACELFALTVEENNPGPCGYVGPPRTHDIDNDLSTTIQPKEYSRRKHYRVVFAEIAKPLYTAQTLSDAFLVLKDVVECLKWIHGSGWVHRDLSSGNLYFYDGRGLIGDLEYARRKDSTTIAHHMRTISIDYMATEVIQRRYIYTDSNVPSCPFFHNDLHDLESLWWVAIYQMLFMLDIKIEPGLSSSEIQLKLFDRRKAREILFPGTDDTRIRQVFLTDEITFGDYISWIPETLEEINEALGVIRVCLVKSYVEFEENFSSEITHGIEQDEFKNSFALCEAVAAQTQRSTRLSLIDKGTFRVFCELRAAANKTEGSRVVSQNRPGFTSNDGSTKPSGKRKGDEGTSEDTKLSRIRRRRTK